MTSSNGNSFRVTGPLCGEFTGQRWIPLTRASDAVLWCFLWSAPWINAWVNNLKAGHLRCHRAHYDVIVLNPSVVGFPSQGPYLKFDVFAVVGPKKLLSKQSWPVIWDDVMTLIWRHFNGESPYPGGYRESSYIALDRVCPIKYEHGFVMLCICFDCFLGLFHWYRINRLTPLNRWRNNNVVITSKPRHFDVITSKWRRFDIITTSLLRDVSAGIAPVSMYSSWMLSAKSLGTFPCYELISCAVYTTRPITYFCLSDEDGYKNIDVFLHSFFAIIRKIETITLYKWNIE